MTNLRTGSRGPDVTRVQTELNRQLFPRPELQLDGIFGGRTDQAVRAFQRNHGLVADGVVGPRTRAALGIAENARPYTHRVRLNFCSISQTDVPFNTILAHPQAVFAPHGIRIDFANGMSLGLDDDMASRLSQVDGSCDWTITGGEYAELFQQGGHIPSNEIGVFFIERFSESINGCGGHLRNRPGCIVAKAGSRWCTAHEVCHVLLGSAFAPVHSNDPRNLMHPVDLPRSATPTLTADQVAQIKRSPLCTAI